MTLDDAILELKSLNEPVPKPARLPTPEEISTVEAQLGIHFPPDFRRYLGEASDIVYGALELVTITLPGAHTDLNIVYASAVAMGIPEGHIPICEDNGDYYLINPDGAITFWSHDGQVDESWPDLATWIKSVLIDEN